MPVARYFVFVGSALAALLLIVSWYCPVSPAISTDRPQVSATAVIRIKSERKWPEKIEFDTRQPTIVPPPSEISSAAAPSAPPPLEETAGKPNLEALAQLSPDTRLSASQHRAVQIKRRYAGTSRSNRGAKVPVANRLAGADAGEACCRFGWDDHWQASANATAHRRDEPLSSSSWFALSQR